MPAATLLPATPFYFARHGETDWNVQRLGQGISDIPLNATGHEQAAALGQQLLEHDRITTIVTSPLQRAQQTAAAVAAHLPRPVVTVTALHEMNLGALEGKPVPDGLFARWYAGEEQLMGETREALHQRVLTGIGQALVAHPGPVLIIAHFCVYYTLLDALGVPFVRIENGEVHLVQPDEAECARWQVKRLTAQP